MATVHVEPAQHATDFAQAEREIGTVDQLQTPRFRNTSCSRSSLSASTTSFRSVSATSAFAISEFVEHYHLERNHQGLDNRLITSVAAPANENADPAAPIARRERLGGLLATTTAPQRDLPSARRVRERWTIGAPTTPTTSHWMLLSPTSGARC
jgi:hypothetical protein